MIRQVKSFPVHDAKSFLRHLTAYGSRSNNFCLLNSNRSFYPSRDKYSGYDLLAGTGSIDVLKPERDSFHSLRAFHDAHRDWLFGFFGYDLKNETAKLSSSNFDGLGFPSIHFFRPQYVIAVRGDNCEIYFDPRHDDEKSADRLFDKINSGVNVIDEKDFPEVQFEIKQRVSHDDYLENVKNILAHIQRGDVYELNCCQEFYSDDAHINSAEIYLRLNDFSPMPFSCFYRCDDKYLLCASPERFLKKSGINIISQPVKGTIIRGKTEAEDSLLKEKLLNDEKERAENVMIVDLVRNDLSHTARKGSVKVEELFGIYSFPHLHQMISTVTSEMRNDVHWTDVIRSAFPMGSMTGAPKIRALQLIEQYEKTKRGLFSGSVGYITPDGDFDFNVVIRSMLYNAGSNYLSFIAGSAITARSNPEMEYEECLLKASAFFKIFSDDAKPTKKPFVHA
ncbi:MAG TPA: anthranilate synthase component I family protein [Bacteroidia bacterium]|nr:anthranilate synthase component I family protein [Bacteroidia bacterium]